MGPLPAMRACAGIVLSLLVAACVAPRVVNYTPFQKEHFSERSRPAEIQKKSAAQLLDGGYLLIGYIDLRHNVRTCWDDGQCVNHSEPVLTDDDLRGEAARRGGDVITLLDERTVLEEKDKSVCTATTTTVVMINKTPQLITVCASYRSIPGKREVRISRALIWRHDPAAAHTEANARAIDAALKTIEVAYRADARSSAENVSSRDASSHDDVSRRVYRAIGEDDPAALNRLARDGTLKTWSDPRGRSALMVALSAHRLGVARTLFQIDPETNRRDRAGLSALDYAAARADLAFVRELVRAGYDPHVKTASGESLLFYALLNPDPTIFEWLLTQGLDPRVPAATGQTTLMVAAESAPAPSLRRLLKFNIDVNARDRAGFTALMGAARSGRPDVIEALVRHHARLDATDDKGNTALHYAAIGGKRETLRELLARGMPINAANTKGATPLFVALGNEKWDAARYLMDRGAALTTSTISAEETAMFLIAKNQPQLLQRYLSAFPPVKTLVRRDPEWLQYAAKTSGHATIGLILGLGARVNHAGIDGLTPLMTAAAAGNADAVRTLLAAKADPTLRDSQNQTALMIATLKGRAKVVEALREFGVKE